MVLKKKTRNRKILVLLTLISLIGLSFISPSEYSDLNILDLPVTSDQEIVIISPENKTYNEPMTGYYPATYGFENDLNGAVPLNWVDTSSPPCYAKVVDNIGGHNKVLEVYGRGQTSSDYAHLYNYFDPQTSETIEWWWRKSSTLSSCAKFIISNETTGIMDFRMDWYADPGKIEYYGSGWTNTGYTDYADDKWIHMSLSFDCLADVYNLTIDGVLYLNNIPFANANSPTHISNIRFYTYAAANPTLYFVDAVGYSWDPGYSIGDNLNEGLLLNYDNTTTLDWQGYSLDGQANKTVLGNASITMPDPGSHKIQVFGNDSLGTMYQSSIRYFSISPINLITPENKTYTEPMSGYYPATFGFENDEDDTIPNGWDYRLTIPQGNSYIKIIPSLDGHEKVLDLNKGDTYGSHLLTGQNFSDQEFGTIEFWLRTTDVTEATEFILRNRNNDASFCAIGVGGQGLESNFSIYTSGGWQSLPYPANNNKWYHIRFQFECGTGNHYGLDQFFFRLYIDGLEIGDFSFSSNQTKADQIVLLQNWLYDNYHSYFDAISFSWDSQYNVGDNQYEGLLLSFENHTNLDWIGYSLDGQSNQSILGNTTIPLLNNGLHSLVLTINDTIGTYYTSELRYFTILTSGPIISAITPLLNQYYGISAPSFSTDVQGANLDKFWYSLDNGITNISFYSYSGDISQSEWDKYTHEPVQINFYVNDSFNRIGYAIVTVNKDLNAPTTTISFVPYSGIYVVLRTTQFSLSATDNSESGVSTTRYKIDDSAWIPYTGAFTLSGYDSGFYSITYQSIDAVGNIETEKSVVIELYIPPTMPEPPNLVPLLVISIGIGLVALIGITIFLLIRKRTPKTPIKARTDEITLSGSDQFKVCPFCYAQIKINAKYCTLCGALLEKD